MRDRWLQTFGEHVARPVHLVVQLITDPKQEIIRLLQLFLLAFADQFPGVAIRPVTGPGT